MEVFAKPTERGFAFGKPFITPVSSQITDDLWQGGHPYLGVPDEFTAILNLYPWGDPYHRRKGVDLRVVKMLDAATVPDRDLLIELADWINERRVGGLVYVHCQAGLNRSGLVTALALIREGMTAEEAISLLREKRSPAVLFNRTFEAWLRAYP